MPNRPGVIAQLALALGRGGVNIVDMALYPASDMTEGVVALWIAGEPAPPPRGGADRRAGLCGGAPVNVRFDPGLRLRGRIAPPPDKSISHRAAIIGAIAAEPVRVANYLDAADTRSTLAAVRELGAIVEDRARGDRHPRRGDAQRPAAGARHRCRQRRDPDAAASRLAGRSSRGRASRWTATARSAGRPVDRIAQPLELMGARVEARDGRYPPFTVHGAGAARASAYELPVASAQVKSCLLLAGLATDGTTVLEPIASRDHTERMLLSAGARVTREPRAGGGYATTVGNADELELEHVQVPGDLSSAAFLIAAGVLVPGARLVLEGVGVNWTRTGFLRILQRMGAIVVGELEEPGAFAAAEPTCDLDVSYGPIVGDDGRGRRGARWPIDELPLVALLGCFAEGETVVRGAGRAAAQGVGPDRDRRRGAARAGGRHRGAAGRLRRARAAAACAAGGSTPTATIAWRCWAPSPGWRPQEGVEVIGMEAADVSYPGFADDIAALAGV